MYIATFNPLKFQNFICISYHQHEVTSKAIFVIHFVAMFYGTFSELIKGECRVQACELTAILQLIKTIPFNPFNTIK